MADDDWDNDGDLDLYADIQVAAPETYAAPSVEQATPQEERGKKRQRTETEAAAGPASAQPPPPRLPKSRVVRVFVGNLAWWTSDADLEKLFAQKDIQARNWEFAIEKVSGKSKGFATCEVKDLEAAESMIRDFHKTSMNGRDMVVCLPAEDQIRAALQRSDLPGVWGEYKDFLAAHELGVRDGPGPGRRERERERDRPPPPMGPPGGMMGGAYMAGPGFGAPMGYGMGGGYGGPMGGNRFGQGGFGRM